MPKVGAGLTSSDLIQARNKIFKPKPKPNSFEQMIKIQKSFLKPTPGSKGGRKNKKSAGFTSADLIQARNKIFKPKPKPNSFEQMIKIQKSFLKPTSGIKKAGALFNINNSRSFQTHDPTKRKLTEGGRRRRA